MRRTRIRVRSLGVRGERNILCYILRFVEKKPRVLDFGDKTFKAFHYLFKKSLCKGIESLSQTFIF